METFESIKRSFYHCISSAPDEPRTGEYILSDIVLHLPVLEYYASQCRHVTEFGTRDGCSTAALIAGCKGEVHSYDIADSPMRRRLAGLTLPCSKWEFHLGDTGSPDLVMAETDLLFLDTLHTYAHLSKELRYHGRKARKYLAFHDTHTCGMKDLSGPDPNAEGILPAIWEFMAAHKGEYKIVYETKVNNGMMILERS